MELRIGKEKKGKESVFVCVSDEEMQGGSSRGEVYGEWR